MISIYALRLSSLFSNIHSIQALCPSVRPLLSAMLASGATAANDSGEIGRK